MRDIELGPVFPDRIEVLCILLRIYPMSSVSVFLRHKTWTDTRRLKPKLLMMDDWSTTQSNPWADSWYKGLN